MKLFSLLSNSNLKNMKTLFKFLFAATCVSLLVTCQKPDQVFNDDSSANELKDAKIHKTYDKGDIVQLSGWATFKTWEVIGGKVVQNSKNEVPTATLEFLGKHDILLTITEIKPGFGPLTMADYGKIADSGELKFNFATPVFPGTSVYITDIIRSSCCATIWGEGINQNTLVFKGKFDGNHLSATAYFMASVTTPCPSLPFNEELLTGGDLHWTEGYELDVVVVP